MYEVYVCVCMYEVCMCFSSFLQAPSSDPILYLCLQLVKLKAYAIVPGFHFFLYPLRIALGFYIGSGDPGL